MSPKSGAPSPQVGGSPKMQKQGTTGLGMDDLLGDEITQEEAVKVVEREKPPPTRQELMAQDVARKRAAKKTLLEVIRKAPRLYIALGLGESADERQLLAGLFAANEPRTCLVTAGVSSKDIAKALHVLEDALACERSPPAIRKRKCGVRASIAFFLFAAGLGSLCGTASILLFGKMGWTSAQCKMKGFYNLSFGASCTSMPLGECSFDIGVRDGKKWLMIQGWEPERERKDDMVSLVGEPFRCCNLGGNMNCCGFEDAKTKRFCDDWPDKEDVTGVPCPEGSWTCLFKASAENPDVVTDLRPDFETPMAFHLLWVAVGCLSLALLVGFAPFWQRSFSKCAEMVMVTLRVAEKGEISSMSAAEKERRTSVSAVSLKGIKTQSSVTHFDKSFLEEEKKNIRRHSMDAPEEMGLTEQQMLQLQAVEIPDTSAELEEGYAESPHASPSSLTPKKKSAWGERKSSDISPKEIPTAESTPSSVQYSSVSALSTAASSVASFPAQRSTVADAPKGLRLPSAIVRASAAPAVSDNKPVLSLKEFAQRANGVWQTPIIEPPRTPVSSRPGSVASSSRPRRIMSAGGADSLKSLSNDPGEGWAWGKDSLHDDTFDVVDLGPMSRQVSGESHRSVQSRHSGASGNGLRQTGMAGSSSRANRPISAHSRGSASSRPRSASSRPHSASSRPRSASRADRPPSAHTRRHDVVTGPPNWAMPDSVS